MNGIISDDWPTRVSQMINLDMNPDLQLDETAEFQTVHRQIWNLKTALDKATDSFVSSVNGDAQEQLNVANRLLFEATNKLGIADKRCTDLEVQLYNEKSNSIKELEEAKVALTISTKLIDEKDAELVQAKEKIKNLEMELAETKIRNESHILQVLPY